MKRYIKSICIMLICVFCVSTYSMQVRAEEKTFGEGIATIAFGENGWWEGIGAVWGNPDDPVSIEKQKTAVLNGDGTYTISINCGEERKELNFLCIQAYGIDNTVGFAVTSVKFDGTEYFNGKTGFTLLDDENENMRRTFILAPDDWYRNYENAVSGEKSPVTAAEDPYATTSKLIDYSPENWQVIEITFDVFGMGTNDTVMDNTVADNTVVDDTVADDTIADDTVESSITEKDKATSGEGKNNNTGLIVLVVAGIVLLGTVGVFVLKKKNQG